MDRRRGRMRPTNRLTVKRVAAAKPPAGRRSCVLCDGGGLYLEVSASANGTVNKSWVFKYERFGRRHELGLGTARKDDGVSLAEAREKASAYRRQLLDDVDPLQARRAQKQALAAEAARRVTFKQCAEEYFRAHGDSWRSDKHRRQWLSSLEQHAFPVLGSLCVDDIQVAHVLRALEKI